MSDYGYYPAVSRFAGDDQTGYMSTVTASGSANTKGSWTTISASCPFDSSGMIMTGQSSNVNATGLMDIGIGGAGSETVIVPNLLMERSSGYEPFAPLWLPISIKAGTRVAVRFQSTTGGDTRYVKFAFAAANGALPFQRATDYGTTLATSVATYISSGGVDTKGSWANLTTNCNQVSYAIIAVGRESFSSVNYRLDIGVGTTVVVPDLEFTVISQFSGSFVGIPLSIPAGSTIAARCACANGSGDMYAQLIGFN